MRASSRSAHDEDARPPCASNMSSPCLLAERGSGVGSSASFSVAGYGAVAENAREPLTRLWLSDESMRCDMVWPSCARGAVASSTAARVARLARSRASISASMSRSTTSSSETS